MICHPLSSLFQSTTEASAASVMSSCGSSLESLDSNTARGAMQMDVDDCAYDIDWNIRPHNAPPVTASKMLLIYRHSTHHHLGHDTFFLRLLQCFFLLFRIHSPYPPVHYFWFMSFLTSFFYLFHAILKTDVF